MTSVKITLDGYTPPVLPTGINLGTDELIVEAGTSKVLIPQVLPEGSTNKRLVWTSSDPSIATVAYSGAGALAIIRGIYPGTATITAETHNGIKETCTVIVTDETGPNVPNKIISIEGKTHNSISISWIPAEDNAFPHDQLQYYVCWENPEGSMI